MKRLITLPALICLLSALGSARTTWYVPDDFPTIQGAISDASVVHGDTIVVRPGTYAEHLDFLGKAITLQGEQGPQNTFVDGGSAGRVVTFANGEGLGSVLDGFTLFNGFAAGGGGILCDHTSPTIRKNIVRDNESIGYGGGIFCNGGSPYLLNNVIDDNIGYEAGGGIGFYLSSAGCVNNIITGNYVWIESMGDPPTQDTYGGGISCHYSSTSITHCVVHGNDIFGDWWTVIPHGAGIYSNNNDVITNSIVRNNTGAAEIEGIFLTPVVNHCNVEGGWPFGTGNIDEDPLFKDPGGNFHLTAQSPCIDAGDNKAPSMPEIDFDGNDRILNGNGDGVEIADMGIDEFMILAVDTYELPETGGTACFLFDAGPDDAHRTYLILGGVSGTEPGTVLPHGIVTLPLNWDPFTDFVWNNKTTALFQDFLGTLDKNGRALAQLNAPPLPPGYVGLMIYFAGTCNDPFDLVTNPLAVKVVE
jgi:hypothetical protein